MEEKREVFQPPCFTCCASLCFGGTYFVFMVLCIAPFIKSRDASDDLYCVETNSDIFWQPRHFIEFAFVSSILISLFCIIYAITYLVYKKFKKQRIFHMLSHFTLICYFIALLCYFIFFLFAFLYFVCLYSWFNVCYVTKATHFAVQTATLEKDLFFFYPKNKKQKIESKK